MHTCDVLLDIVKDEIKQLIVALEYPRDLSSARKLDANPLVRVLRQVEYGLAFRLRVGPSIGRPRAAASAAARWRSSLQPPILASVKNIPRGR